MTILHALLCAVFLGQPAAPPAVSLDRLAEEMLASTVLFLDRRRSTLSCLRPSYVGLIQGDYPCGRLGYSPGCCL
jgi:hypothetical protein